MKLRGLPFRVGKLLFCTHFISTKPTDASYFFTMILKATQHMKWGIIDEKSNYPLMY